MPTDNAAAGQRIEAIIAATLESRRNQQPVIERMCTHWAELQRQFDGLIGAVAQSREDIARTATADANGLNAAMLNELRVFLDGWTDRGKSHDGAIQMRGKVAAVVADTHRIRARVSRRTINIGVLGRTKAGKSTLLRQISGLSPDIIPTSAMLPTTASRSRLYHDPVRRCAELTLHSYASFRDRYLAPRHMALSLGPPPPTPDAFVYYRYPTWPEYESRQRGNNQLLRPSNRENLTRLRTAQDGFDGFRDLLATTESVALQLQDSTLRSYIAYPTSERGRERDPHRYLAVQDLHIYTQFARAAVQSLGLVDLPGMNEHGIDVGEQFLGDLRNDVDVLWQIKRTSRQSIGFGADDVEVQDLAHFARGDVPLDKFVVIMVNSDAELSNRNEVAEAVAQARAATSDNGILVLCGDVTSGDDVEASLLRGGLDHLARNLEEMDRLTIGAVQERAQRTATEVRAFASWLRDRAYAWRAELPHEAETLDRLVNELRGALAKDLGGISDVYLRAAREGQRHNELERAVEGAKQTALQWVDSGFGEASMEAWRSRTEGFLVMQPFAEIERQCDRTRIVVNRAFSGIDASLNSAIAELRSQIADVLRQHLSETLVSADDGDSSHALGMLHEHLRRSNLPNLARPIDTLLQLDVHYESLFLGIVRPRVRDIGPDQLVDRFSEKVAGRRHLRRFSIRKKSTTPAMASLAFTVETATNRTKLLGEVLQRLAHDVVDQLAIELLSESTRTLNVLFAAADQFFDDFARDELASKELFRLCEPHVRTIWPDAFDDSAARLRRGVSSVEVGADHVVRAVWHLGTRTSQTHYWNWPRHSTA